jgi:hypothetical protein
VSYLFVSGTSLRRVSSSSSGGASFHWGARARVRAGVQVLSSASLSVVTYQTAEAELQ